MTISGISGPACREIRQLLGVYVVGAIDPAERASWTRTWTSAATAGRS